MLALATGVYYSDDKMFQGRVFSYADAQRYRLGANYLMLPVNAPKNAHHNNHHDGAMNFMHRDEEVSFLGTKGANLALPVELLQPWSTCNFHAESAGCICCMVLCQSIRRCGISGV